MKAKLRMAIMLVVCAVVLSVAAPASANTSTLRCNPAKDRVWVYDSLASFNVQGKIECGEKVEVLERAKNYVRIRASNGVEGYVPDTDFVDLPAYAFHAAPATTPDVGSVAKQVQAKEIAKVAASESVFHVAKEGSAPTATGTSVAAANGSLNSKKRGASSLTSTAALAEFRSPEKGPETPASVVTVQPVTAAEQPEAVAAPVVTAPAAQPVTQPAVVAAKAKADADADEEPSYKLEAKADDLACTSYFSAYGLTSSQLKWIALNRKKLFPNVCPAPEPSKVNFVMIFTHDVNFFGATLPQPVHKAGGFSDFQPLSMVDDALTSGPDADKAHRQYVWIFQYPDGGFNPDKFSPRRKYEFTKVETNSVGFKAAPKVVEDALRFAENPQLAGKDDAAQH
jgi:hypothetical protein